MVGLKKEEKGKGKEEPELEGGTRKRGDVERSGNIDWQDRPRG